MTTARQDRAALRPPLNKGCQSANKQQAGGQAQVARAQEEKQLANRRTDANVDQWQDAGPEASLGCRWRHILRRRHRLVRLALLRRLRGTIKRQQRRGQVQGSKGMWEAAAAGSGVLGCRAGAGQRCVAASPACGGSVASSAALGDTSLVQCAARLRTTGAGWK